MTWYWTYAVRSSNMCAKLFTDMPWSSCNRIVKKNKWKKVFLPTETPRWHWPFWRPVVGWNTFGTLAPAREPPQKNWLCHRLALSMAVSMMSNTTCDVWVDIARGIRGREFWGRLTWTSSHFACVAKKRCANNPTFPTNSVRIPISGGVSSRCWFFRRFCTHLSVWRCNGECCVRQWQIVLCAQHTCFRTALLATPHVLYLFHKYAFSPILWQQARFYENELNSTTQSSASSP